MISNKELNALLNEKEPNVSLVYLLFDAEYNALLKNKKAKSTIPGSKIITLESISDTLSIHKHQLNPKVDYGKLIGGDSNTMVVIYESKEIAGAARLYYLIKQYYDNVVILKGGLFEWNKMGFKVDDSDTIELEKICYLSSSNDEKTIIKFINFDEFKKILDNANEYVIIDTRMEVSFKAEFIKSTICIPWKRFLVDGSSDEIITDKSKLLKIFPKDIKNKKIVTLCYTGVTACIPFFCLDILNIKYEGVYDGSFDEYKHIYQRTKDASMNIIYKK